MSMRTSEYPVATASTARLFPLRSAKRATAGATMRLSRPPLFTPRKANASSFASRATTLSIAVSAISMPPAARAASCAAEFGAARRVTSRRSCAKRPLSCATNTGQLELPVNPITRSAAGDCASAGAAAIARTKRKPLNLIVPSSGTAVSHAKRWAMIPKMVRRKLVACALMVCAGAVCGANRDIYLYRGADRDARLAERAKQEGPVLFYSTMTVQDGKLLGAAFERKYGLKAVHWRGSAEKIVQRALTEARASRYDVDVIETSVHRMEVLRREGLLEDFHTPAFAELSPAAFARDHRQYVADRFAFFVLGYNTKLVKPDEVPASYEDLLHPRWAGRLAIESTDVLWFAALAKAMGEEKGVAYFRRLAAMKPMIRSGHILGAQLVASGEIPLFVTAYNNNIETLKRSGAPVEWKPLSPVFGQASTIGLAKHSRRPHAALLFVDFVLSRDGQEVLKSVNRVPASLAVDSPLNKFPHQMIDPSIALDEGDKWEKLWSALFLGGKPVEREE